MRGDLAEAEERYQVALERMERLGIVQSVAWLLPQLADLAFFRGDWSRADELLQRFDTPSPVDVALPRVQVDTVRAQMRGGARGRAARRSVGTCRRARPRGEGSASACSQLSPAMRAS